LVTLYTPAKVGNEVPELPYTMYDWNNDNKAYTKLPGGNLTLHKDVHKYKVGDVNADGSVDAADIASIVSIITGVLPQGSFDGREDVNSDGNIDAGDIATLVEIITAGD